MDIWLAAVLVAWLPIAAALALLVGRSVAQADLKARAASLRARTLQSFACPAVIPPAATELTVRQRVAS